MTLLWFVVWLVFDLIGDREPLQFDPVNFWAGWLLLAVALDLAGAHAKRRPAHARHRHDHAHEHEHPHEH